jgi:hypothetical protein
VGHFQKNIIALPFYELVSEKKKFGLEFNALIELKPISVSTHTCSSIYPSDDLVSGFMDLEIQHFG